MAIFGAFRYLWNGMSLQRIFNGYPYIFFGHGRLNGSEPSCFLAAIAISGCLPTSDNVGDSSTVLGVVENVE